MTKRKPDARFRCPPHEERKHYACLLRDFVLEAFKSEVTRLNCSQGVYLEILLIKGLEAGLVTSADVFEYDAQERSDGRIASMDFVGAVQDGKRPYYDKLSLRDRYKTALSTLGNIPNATTIAAMTEADEIVITRQIRERTSLADK